jgi:dual specificity phosphatase 12
MKKIDKNLYLSNSDDALNIYTLWKLNIKYAIDCTKNNYHIKDPTIKVIQFPSSDPPSEGDVRFIIRNIRGFLLVINKLIADGHNILIFCNKGRKRSVTLVIAYLMNKFRISSELALRIIQYIHYEAFLNASYNSYFIINEFNRIL